MSASFAIRQSEIILARLFYGFFEIARVLVRREHVGRVVRIGD